jgi:hypothetical protein
MAIGNSGRGGSAASQNTFKPAAATVIFVLAPKFAAATSPKDSCCKAAELPPKHPPQKNAASPPADTQNANAIVVHTLPVCGKQLTEK